MTYAEKLKDPRWQKKRLEILNRDGFKCTRCESEKKTLHVHHLYYNKGFEPWEARSEHLETLCEDCHQQETDVIKGALYGFGEALKRHGATSKDMMLLTNILNDMDKIDKAAPLVMMHILLDKKMYASAVKKLKGLANEYINRKNNG